MPIQHKRYTHDVQRWHRTRDKDTQSGWSVPKCNGANRALTDTRGDEEIFQTFSTQMVKEIFLFLLSKNFRFVHQSFSIFLSCWKKHDQLIGHHQKRTWPFWRVWASAETVSSEPCRQPGTMSKQPPTCYCKNNYETALYQVVRRNFLKRKNSSYLICSLHPKLSSPSENSPCNLFCGPIFLQIDSLLIWSCCSSKITFSFVGFVKCNRVEISKKSFVQLLFDLSIR